MPADNIRLSDIFGLYLASNYLTLKNDLKRNCIVTNFIESYPVFLWRLINVMEMKIVTEWGFFVMGSCWGNCFLDSVHSSF